MTQENDLFIIVLLLMLIHSDKSFNLHETRVLSAVSNILLSRCKFLHGLRNHEKSMCTMSLNQLLPRAWSFANFFCLADCKV